MQEHMSRMGAGSINTDTESKIAREGVHEERPIVTEFAVLQWVNLLRGLD